MSPEGQEIWKRRDKTNFVTKQRNNKEDAKEDLCVCVCVLKRSEVETA